MEVSLQSFRTRFSYDSQKDLLGKGGFGDVYKAYDNEDQIFVALKIAHASADDKHNLINEIKRFKKLNHPNIIKHIEAYEVNTGGFDIHGRPIINHVGVLEYADKGTLADLLKQQNVAGFQNPQRLRNIIEDLANDIIDGLAYLHSQNIIHRDLKPTNILLFSEGDKLRAKITDFGIAKKADATAASTQLVGTVEYMAPEYFTTGNISKASDIWSLGVMLLEALSGTHPFGKTTQGLSNEQIIRNILSKDLQENLTNAPLKELLTRCLLREPNLRPQSAEELNGLMLSGGDTFAERTQIISLKKKSLETEKTKSKWKRLITALFDFDIRNGRWKKVLAKEIFILFMTTIVLTGFILGLLTFNALSKYFYDRKYSININSVYAATDSIYSLIRNNDRHNLPSKEVFDEKYKSGFGYRKLTAIVLYHKILDTLELRKLYYPENIMTKYSEHCNIFNAYESYTTKGFNGSFKDFEYLILLGGFLDNLHKDYVNGQKFEGNINDFIKMLYSPTQQNELVKLNHTEIGYYLMFFMVMLVYPLRLTLLVSRWVFTTLKDI